MVHQMVSDPKDGVDRIFACFKCGISAPESAISERSLRSERSKKAGLVRGEASVVAGVVTPSLSEQCGQDSVGKEKLGTFTSVTIKLKSGKQISPIVFCGYPYGAPIKRASQLFGFLNEIHVDLNEENDLKLRYNYGLPFQGKREQSDFKSICTS